jgi:F-box/leucine-rich repeat protein 2/20
MDFGVRPQLKSLDLGCCSWLTDERIITFASVFPNLQRLDLSYCNNISDECIRQVLSRCCKIRYLNLASCSGVKLHGMNFEFPKLEVLNLSDTEVDDKTLYVISKSCRGLLQLLLKNCDYVTANGVKHVVENCTQLREINLDHCDNVKSSVVESMVFSSPQFRNGEVSIHESALKVTFKLRG